MSQSNTNGYAARSAAKNGEDGTRCAAPSVSNPRWEFYAHDGLANRCPNTTSRDKSNTYENNKNHLVENLALLIAKYPDLAEVVKRWPELPEHIKATIKALVPSHKTKKKE